MIPGHRVRMIRPLTREIAWAASTDAGNRSMRSSGRETWSEDDYNAAVAEFDRLWPAEIDVYGEEEINA